jgi:mono/diheme cytochrome c family protein
MSMTHHRTIENTLLAPRIVTRSAAVLLLVSVLAACGGEGGGAPAASESTVATSTKVTPDLLDKGAGVYKANCVPCHGPLGKGDGPSSATLDPKPRDHTNRVYMDTLTDQQIAATIVQGGAPKYPNMPSHPHIQGENLAAVVAHVRKLSHGGEPVASVDLPAK